MTIELVVARSDLLDGTTFERIRAGVPAARRRRSDAYHRQTDRYASVVAFSLLQHLWRERSSGPMPDVVVGELGKPRFDGSPGWHFNWSHDASVCVCVLSPVPVGVDVQSRVPFHDGLFDRIAAPGERGLRDPLLRADDLSPLWTRKEALVKRTGRGLTTPLQQVDTVSAPDVLTLSDDALGVRISVSAEGLSEHDLFSRLRPRRVEPAPGSASWVGEPGRGALRRVDFGA
ncbi:4'-phosphopantetheinyl transferase family protein [Antribacter gilvus]|uniref:4'-phosphopantetheinyl transferase family protein n=1 Tax=Antribacter gilvus TaxID=2304675 RepID=UPI000F7A5BCD|nr:4'-phosphopantetheinyl transferase superfamily protein [Antribacter gilvus]